MIRLRINLVENSKTKATELDSCDRKDNQTQFIQRRIVEKIQKITKSEGIPKITCVECDEVMLIVAKNDDYQIARCRVCNHSTVIEW